MKKFVNYLVTFSTILFSTNVLATLGTSNSGNLVGEIDERLEVISNRPDLASIVDTSLVVSEIDNSKGSEDLRNIRDELDRIILAEKDTLCIC